MHQITQRVTHQPITALPACIHPLTAAGGAQSLGAEEDVPRQRERLLRHALQAAGAAAAPAPLRGAVRQPLRGPAAATAAAAAAAAATAAPAPLGAALRGPGSAAVLQLCGPARAAAASAFRAGPRLLSMQTAVISHSPTRPLLTQHRSLLRREPRLHPLTTPGVRSASPQVKVNMYSEKSNRLEERHRPPGVLLSR